jgi:hypothetical protein
MTVPTPTFQANDGRIADLDPVKRVLILRNGETNERLPVRGDRIEYQAEHAAALLGEAFTMGQLIGTQFVPYDDPALPPHDRGASYVEELPWEAGQGVLLRQFRVLSLSPQEAAAADADARAACDWDGLIAAMTSDATVKAMRSAAFAVEPAQASALPISIQSYRDTGRCTSVSESLAAVLTAALAVEVIEVGDFLAFVDSIAQFNPPPRLVAAISSAVQEAQQT